MSQIFLYKKRLNNEFTKTDQSVSRVDKAEMDVNGFIKKEVLNNCIQASEGLEKTSLKAILVLGRLGGES